MTPRFLSRSASWRWINSRPALNDSRFGRRRRVEGAIEIVDDRQQIADHVRGRPFDHLLAIAIDALAEVVELGGLAEQAIVEIVAFFLQRIGRRAGAPVSCGGLLGRSRAGVLWIEWLVAHDSVNRSALTAVRASLVYVAQHSGDGDRGNVDRR